MSSIVRTYAYPIDLMDRNGKSLPGQNTVWSGPGFVFAAQLGPNKFLDVEVSDLAFLAAGAGAEYIRVPHQGEQVDTFKVVTWPIETLVECPLPGLDSVPEVDDSTPEADPIPLQENPAEIGHCEEPTESGTSQFTSEVMEMAKEDEAIAESLSGFTVSSLFGKVCLTKPGKHPGELLVRYGATDPVEIISFQGHTGMMNGRFYKPSRHELTDLLSRYGGPAFASDRKVK